MPPNAALNTRGTGTALPQPNLSADVAQSPLSPSDCRTLKKILEDVQGPFPTASPLSIKHNENHLGAEYTQDSSSDTSNEDEVQHMENCYDYGDEVDEGYEDEDGSMNLSDTVEESRDDNAVQEDQSMFIDEDDSRGYAWSDGDTIEDIMNMPGETAPLAPQQDLGVDLHDQPLSDANKEIKLKRATVEAVLEQERLDQEHQDAAAIGDGIIDLDATHVGGQDDAVVLSDDPEFWAVEAVQAEIGMSLIENNVVRVVEFEVSFALATQLRAQHCSEKFNESHADLDSTSSLSTGEPHGASLLLRHCVEHQQTRCHHPLSSVSQSPGLQ
jgi:hypothetical protein